MAADQHQPLLRPLLNHGADKVVGGGFEKVGGLIGHLKRLVPQSGAQQTQSMNSP